MGLVRGSSGEGFPEAHGWTSTEVLNRVIRNYIPLILIFLPASFLISSLPPSPFPQSWRSQPQICFAPVACWNLPSARLEFYKFSFVLGCLLKSVLFRFSPTQPWPKGIGASSPVLLIAQLIQWSFCLLLMHRWMRLLPGPLAYLDPRTLTEGLLFMDGCLTSCLKGGTKRNILCHYDADITCPCYIQS